ncbi:helix-turn-helix domain-containing protein [Jeotgalibacillus haloalkalitolerans]|uniref:Helix-turn-helix domain-containing protein n=1 Tax=Jeotgalibacillus haloalkalitolerans TaxID=3104292 RepID=A0ABU5KK55_9BACL|nr:helix-turn-helix domain-containing protein [Jeotgalibacillus sp. HH7-29]MDZ5711618.1 helix-turn-helix domain-containing protein [Jeotgalibacillus sp. HH7-29]
MLKVELDLDQLQAVIKDAIDQAMKEHAVKNELPPVLSKTQFQEFLGISHSKAVELMKRGDFPVFREAGHPRVPTKQLFEWIDLNTKWVKRETKYLNRVI